MHVKQVDVVRLQLLQRGFNAQAQRLGAVAGMVGDKTWLVVRPWEACCELCRNDHGVAVLARGEPLADPRLGLFGLIVVCT